METKLSVLFIGKKSMITRHGLLPIYLRVTVNKTQFEVSTNRHVEPSQWWSTAGRVRGRLASLTTDHIKVSEDGKKWLIKPRQKTGIPEIVPVFPPALRILCKYEGKSPLKASKKLLLVPTNQKVNAYPKELADICGFKQRLFFILPVILLLLP